MGRIEILTIGDELVEGRLVDSNSAALSERLFSEGIEVVRHTSIGDRRDEIVAALREAARRADAVLVSGGLGPTSDDITAACAAEAFGVPLVRSPDALAHVEQFFASHGRPMSPNNAKQADLPAGCQLLPNPWGTAVGFRVVAGRCRLYFMPGVPRELEGMFSASVLPELAAVLERQSRWIAQLKVFGAGESDVARMLEGLEEGLPAGARLTIQYRATFPEIHVRLVLAGVGDGAAAEELLGGLADEARRRLGRHVYATGGALLTTTFPEQVISDLRRAGRTLAVAEGCTSGAVAQLLGAVSGSGDVFLGSLVASGQAALADLLEVAQSAGQEPSEELARGMAAAVRDRLHADLGAAVVGTPAQTSGHPEGGLVVALARADGCTARSFPVQLEPERFRLLAAYVTLGQVRRALTEEATS